MSVPGKLAGGILTQRDPNRLVTAPQAEQPFIRLVEPLDLYLSSATLLLLRRAAVLTISKPDTAFVEVAVREVDGNRYIIIAPTTEQNPRREPLTLRPGVSGAEIRTADDVLLAGGISAQPGWAYRMDAFLVEDADLQWVVAANFTQARIEARRLQNPADQAAAGQIEG